MLSLLWASLVHFPLVSVDHTSFGFSCSLSIRLLLLAFPCASFVHSHLCTLLTLLGLFLFTLIWASYSRFYFFFEVLLLATLFFMFTPLGFVGSLSFGRVFFTFLWALLAHSPFGLLLPNSFGFSCSLLLELLLFTSLGSF
jgi:hypothetical protein